MDATRSVIFDDSFTLRARVFSDGTPFRFAVDGYGWRTVTTDLAAGVCVVRATADGEQVSATFVVAR